MEAAPASLAPEGRLADNIAFFARALRRAGLKLGPSATLDAIAAVEAAGLSTRDDFYWTLHCVLVTRREDEATFDEAFRLFWRSRDLLEAMIALFPPAAPSRAAEPRGKRAGEDRVADALAGDRAHRGDAEERPETDVDARRAVSGADIFRAKDFAQMSAAEIEDAKAAIAGLRLPADRTRTRRYRPDPRGERIDPRRMMQASLRSGGDLILPKFRSRREVQPPLVVIADISGSMSQYTRIFLHFLHALTEQRRHVHTFLFGTRLTNVTRRMRHRDPDAALADCAGAVRDWSGGTRIADALHVFNHAWSRRVLTQGAVAIIITDGLERGSVEELGAEMERLHKSCRRLIWLNPLLRFDGFAARARGVRAMLPHVDEFRAVHSLDAMHALCAALSGKPGRESDPKRWLAAADAAVAL